MCEKETNQSICPGNPGLAGFYQEFMKSLHGKVGNPDLSIWALSHAGHHRPEVSWIPAGTKYTDYSTRIFQYIIFAAKWTNVT